MSLPEPSRWSIASVALLALLVACANPEPRAERAQSPAPPATAEHEEHEEHDEGIVELSPEAAANAAIRTALVEERALARELETTGQVDFDQTRLAHISPRISGRVHQVGAVLGQAVRAGQTLVEIDSIELGRAKAEYLQAKAKEQLARKSFDRVQGLVADRIASEQELLEAEAALRETSAALQTWEETLHLYGLSQQQVDSLGYDDPAASIYPLRAPISGTIVEQHASLGELVTPEHNLFTLADLTRVWIWADVHQRDLGQVHLDDEVRARVDAFPEEVFSGTVSYLSARVDADTRTVRARLEVANLEGKLRPGMFVEVTLLDPHAVGGREAESKSLVVPETAIVRDGDEALVFVATGERRYERREVLVGRRAGGWVEILGGQGHDPLEPGDAVAVEGVFLLKSAASKESMGEGHSH